MINLNNIMDIGVIPVNLVLGAFFSIGSINAVLGKAKFKFDFSNNILNSYGFAGIVFTMFLYLQRKLHKEVFVEYHSHLQTEGEFKTIFN
jgi:hypothetical protein